MFKHRGVTYDREAFICKRMFVGSSILNSHLDHRGCYYTFTEEVILEARVYVF